MNWIELSWIELSLAALRSLLSAFIRFRIAVLRLRAAFKFKLSFRPNLLPLILPTRLSTLASFPVRLPIDAAEHHCTIHAETSRRLSAVRPWWRLLGSWYESWRWWAGSDIGFSDTPAQKNDSSHLDGESRAAKGKQAICCDLESTIEFITETMNFEKE